MDANPVRTGRDDRRQSILDVARDTFLQEGYAATSMSAIAARLGGSKGTLYNYFPSKELLFVALMKQECEAGDWMRFPEQVSPESLASDLFDIGWRFLNFVLSERARSIHRLVIAESSRFPELGHAFYENGPKLGITAFSAWVGTQMEAGLLRRADCERAAVAFLSLCKSELYQRAIWAVETDPPHAARKVTVDGAVEIFLAAYGADAGRRTTAALVKTSV